jgi:DNA polymerase-3 subunit gamma/tau
LSYPHGMMSARAFPTPKSMGHLSLYRKYRPQTFEEVVGQEHVTRTLIRGVEEGRVAHAYLFSGPRGTGKTSTARILAKALNCEKGPTPTPCNSCTACLEITEGNSLDVVEIDAASHGSVDDARELREKVAYAPVGGSRRLYIIDECHMLSAAANNALLKLLEEPPEHVTFVFATTEPNKVLQTLLDRCQRYEFRALNSSDIASQVSMVCDAEAIEVDDDAINLIASRAGGSMRDGLSLLEQLVSYAGAKVGLDDVTHLLGSLPEDLLFEAVDLISERDVGAVMVFADRLIKEGRDLREFGRALVEHLRSLFLILHAPAAREILEVTDERLERLEGQAHHFDSAEMLRIIDLANEANLEMRQGAEGRLVIETALARMARPDLHATPASLLARIERLERLAGIEEVIEIEEVDRAARQPRESRVSKPDGDKRPAPKPSKQEEPRKPVKESEGVAQQPEAAVGSGSRSEKAPSPTEGLDIEKVSRAWDLVREKVKSKKMTLGAMLIEAKPVAFEADELVLQFSPRHRFHHDQVGDPERQGPLVEAFHETFGVRPRVRCVLTEEETVPPPETSDEAPAPSESRDPIDLIRASFKGAEVVEEE